MRGRARESEKCERESRRRRCTPRAIKNAKTAEPLVAEPAQVRKLACLHHETYVQLMY